MISRPAFNPYYTVYSLGSDGVVLLSDDEPQLLRGRLYTLVVPLIDGRRTVEEIVSALAGQCSPAEVYFVLYRLEQKGYLIDQDAPPQKPYDPARTAFWKANGLDATLTEARLREATVAVRAVGNVEAGSVTAGLQALGVTVQEDGQLTVVITDDYLRPELRDINRQALASGRPWLLAKPVGAEIWLGPLFRPDVTGCWECLAHRLAHNREVAAYLEHRLQLGAPIVLSTASLPSTRAIGEQMLITEVVRWLAVEGAKSTSPPGDPPTGKTWTNSLRGNSLEGKVVTLDTRNWRREEHILTRRPQCPACGKPLDQQNTHPQPLRLQSRKKSFTADGGHRAVDPEVTLATYGHLVSPITGVVQFLRRQGEGHYRDPIVHVYGSGHNVAVRAGSFADFRRHFRSMSAGKGMTEFQWVPEPFHDEATVSWTPVWSLTEKRYKYIPTMSCYFLYRPGEGEPRFARACSNGNATGNTLEEAIVQGFLELVERDAVAIWWYNRLRKSAVDLQSFGEPYFTRLQERYRTAGRELWVLDITSDLNVPAFAAVSRRINGESDELLFGFGAHFDARVAVARALTEMNQMAVLVDLALRQAGASDNTTVDDPELLHWLKNARLDEQLYLAPAEGLPPKRASDYPSFQSDDLLDDVLRCQAIVEGIGLEMLVLDLTRPDVGMPAVKVFVPGLRHFWARFAPGRLYDVPVARGELARPLKEEELNPIPVFL